MKYTHRRRFHKILRRNQITSDHIKKFLKVVFTFIALWFMFFQGTTAIPSRDHILESDDPSKVLEKLKIFPIIAIVGYLVFLYLLWRILNWWFYTRGEDNTKVRMVTYEEKIKYEEQEKKMKK